MASLRSQLRHRDQEVDRIGEVASKLTQERDGVTDIVRQEFADRYAHHDRFLWGEGFSDSGALFAVQPNKAL